MKKVRRSKKGKIIAGIFSGLGQYLNIDPTILRLIWILFTIFSGFFAGIIIYILAAIIIPEEK